jgi:hydroxyacylglutathione hydrolase
VHAVRVVEPAFEACGGAARIHVVPAAADNLVWLVECTRTGDVAVVDGPPDPAILLAIDAKGLRVRAIWNTHTHGDHVGVNRLFAAADRLGGVDVVGPASVAAQVPQLTHPVDDGDVVRIGEVTARVWRTEGHLRGHLSYVLDDVVFCGDTLFTGGCGYLFDGPPEAMHASLTRLAALPPETRVCCAHEYTEDNLRFATSVEPGNAALAARVVAVAARRAEGRATVPGTIGEERATNPFLRTSEPEIRRAVGLDAGAPDAAVFAAVRRLKDSKKYKEG